MHDEDRPTHPLRARHSPVAGDTPEANELAEWLRARVNGRTTRQLQGLFACGRTQWSEFLKGRKLIPLWLLDDVVTKLVPPREQQLQRGIGHKLLHDAEQADEARRAAASPAVPPSDTPHEYQIRLDDARQGQIKAQETVQSLTHLIYAFISAMADLNQRCKNLEAERDQARLRLEQQEADTATVNQQRAAENRRRAAEDQQRLAEVEQRLAEAERRHAEFEERLARARREQQEAEDLRIEAFWKAEENRRAFKQLTGQDVPAGSAGEDPSSVSAPQPWEYDHFLETADAQLDSHNDSMDTIREQIGVPVPPVHEDTRTVLSVVVPTPSTKNTETGPTSGETVRPVPEDTTDNPSATPTEGPAPMPKDTNWQSPGTVPTPSGPGGRPGRKGKGPRVALIGTACLALLAGGGWLTWNHYNSNQGSDDKAPEYTLADSETIQRAENDVLKIGVKEDQPGLSENMGTEDSPDWKGFDIEVAKKIANDLGFKEDKIEFVPVGTRSREQRLESGDADLVVGSYSITEEREKRVDFAGPYLTTDQGMMVYTGESGNNALVEENGEPTEKEIKDPEDFPDGTKVCTVGSSYSEAVLKQFPKTKFKLLPPEANYQTCINGLNEDMDVHVVVTDRPILAGFLKDNPELSMVPNPLNGSTTHWGIGIRKNEPALHHFVCKSIADLIDSKNWYKLFDKDFKETLDKAHVSPRAPGKKDRSACL
ncbi:transporter substrate-binding domain-containing protein [Streptomyces halstedii]|uniref:transporter substrate-binding domain-containing protein n=1 Tax=Streptomyces halstedii TaxID=1944 RepID=UPI00382C5D9A